MGEMCAPNAFKSTMSRQTLCFLLVTLRCCPSAQLSVHSRTPLPHPPPQTWLLGSSGNFKQLWFSDLYFFKISFSPKIVLHLQKMFSLSLVYAFLDASHHPECLHYFHPKLYFNELWVKQGGIQCYQAFLFVQYMPDNNEREKLSYHDNADKK